MTQSIKNLVALGPEITDILNDKHNKNLHLSDNNLKIILAAIADLEGAEVKQLTITRWKDSIDIEVPYAVQYTIRLAATPAPAANEER